MDLDAYVLTHAREWERLEELTRRRRLTGAESDELVDRYQQVATHLSVVRTAAPDHDDAAAAARGATRHTTGVDTHARSTADPPAERRPDNTTKRAQRRGVACYRCAAERGQPGAAAEPTWRLPFFCLLSFVFFFYVLFFNALWVLLLLLAVGAVTFVVYFTF